jgi:hypothetical protein
MKALSLPKAKYQSLEILMKAYHLASNYHYHMKSVECAALMEELTFYRSTYSLQKRYIEELMDSFRKNFEQLENDLEISLGEPLKLLIEKFWRMKDDSTENNLKDFLGYFKANIEKFEKLLNALSQMPEKNDVALTFDQIYMHLNNDIQKLNSEYLKKLKELESSLVDLKNLSAQSDSILNEILFDTSSISRSIT